MAVYLHELHRGRRSLLIWTLATAFFAAMCIFMYPEMKTEMGAFSRLFASMGAFSAAFGLDKLDFGSLRGFYAVECGTILSVGGAFYISIEAVGMLSKEEKDRTAEFLYTHPIPRGKVLCGKLLALITELAVMNIFLFLTSFLCVLCIGEGMVWKEIVLLHSSYFLCQTELGLICFGISAFCRQNSIGIGLGLTLAMYFLNIIANIAGKAKFLKNVTPFGYTEGADILGNMGLNTVPILLGCLAGALITGIGCGYYRRKDIKY